MFKTGSTVYLNVPTDGLSRGELHSATVVEFSSGGITIALDESKFPLQPGQDAFLYFDRRQTFMQQAVKVQAVLCDGEDNSTKNEAASASSGSNGRQATNHTEIAPASTRVVVGLQVVSEPISADGRSTYRVVTSINGGILATLENGNKTAVLDVSATGFSVISKQPLRRGQVVRAIIHYQNEEFHGTAIVQSIKELPTGKLRFGLHCAGDQRSNGQLHRGLQSISAAVQREQLRRSSGAA